MERERDTLLERKSCQLTLAAAERGRVTAQPVAGFKWNYLKRGTKPQ